METIEEQSKSEMSISPPPSPENLRICLVGDVINDASTVEAAQTFGVPIITSETGLELINDCDWRTYFILNDFESPVYDAIHKSKQCILGPPALKQSAAMKDGLTHNARPIYNYSMRGVVTCFTGIRKKDELTKLVNLIHSMGGCIRKDMNSKITHLISTHSGGDKYQYAKTFRLTVVRPAWVYAAWERKNDIDFKATTEEFSKDHRLKAFEGQKICFFGFPADEHQHMIDVLKSNGGVPAELDDPECSHVVMPNTGGYFSETLANNSNTNNNNNSKILSNTNQTPQKTNNNNPLVTDTNAMEVDDEDELEKNNVNEITNKNEQQNELTNVEQNEVYDDDDDDHFDERLVVDYEGNLKQDANEDDLVNDLILPYNEEGLESLCTKPQVIDSHASTPKSSKSSNKKLIQLLNEAPKLDGKILNNESTNDFQQNTNISPIYGGPTVNCLNNESKPEEMNMNKIDNCAPLEMEADDDLDNEADLEDAQSDLKRKRESFDSVSLMSVESFVLPTSTKKPKLLRTGSITRSIKRSMSFVAVRTPIAKMLRPRRSSVALDSAPNDDHTDDNNENADDSICSIASVETTFNESIRKPVKEKFRSLRNRITRSSSRKEKYVLNAASKSPEKDSVDCLNEKEDFKTPKAPSKFANATCSSAPRTLLRCNSSASKSSTSTTSKLCNKSLNLTLNDLPSSSSSNSTTCPLQLPLNVSKNIADVACVNNTFSTTTTISTTTSTSTFLACTNPTTALPSSNQSLQITNHHQSNVNHNMLNVDMICPAVSNNELVAAAVNTNSGAHIQTVVDEHATQAKPEPKNHRTHILKSDWFWYTIQNGYADEMDYLFGDYLDSIANTPNCDRRDSLPISFNKRKRKRFSQRIQLEGTPLGSGKRRSSVSDAGLLSVSGSFFDCTTSPDKLESGKLLTEPETSVCEQTPTKKSSMRFNHFMDFYSTESNYVGILDTIVNLFKNPLEEIAETNEVLLNKSEIRAIFGNFIPIHEVHQSMLERLRSIHSKWTEDCSIGDIILQHRDDLIKAYPPYVNFFEQMKETLQHCDTQNPRFHAFLKINQTKPECGRQSLQDLMIRPVQRLPSISLLLNDILKHTNKSNPDYARLEEALKAIKEVMMHINEDKRKTESRMAIFDIFNDIEGCPAHLVSSNRNFISRCEVTELTDNLSGRGDNLMLYLFSDTIEVCKKRSRGFNSAKSPSTNKSFKHIKLISLNAIRFVIDITDSPRAFALLCRQDKDKLHSFTISDEEIDKVVYLKTLCKQMAENACRTDTDKALLCRTSQELEVDISDVNLSTLSKAFKLAARTRLKVGRAFSFNKTPSKLKRAVSTMMTSPFGSTNSLTPASQLAQMRLASCTNIHEVVDEESSGLRSSSPSAQSEVLPPLSVQPTRKNKSCTLNSVGRI
ncbi:protein ECT2 isoform X1 [Lucilia cuprina]|uniref:protein ECT2 isoform X1 n=1 Tax=Lucilia cuprina TaxID=7375 RepID=UPI001F070916|nr:protein ECT2 isoform X1 [Lucilia cuprina]